jgi:hypothetical protein
VLGAGVSELSAYGTITCDGTGGVMSANLSGESVLLDHLRMLAGFWTKSGGRDRTPFWGGWTGSLRVAFDRLQTKDRTFTDVGGTLELDSASMQLKGLHVGLDAPREARAEGLLSFEAGTDFPYRLKGTVAIDPFKAAPYFPPSEPDGQPAIEGRCSISVGVAGRGLNLADLASHTQDSQNQCARGRPAAARHVEHFGRRQFGWVGHRLYLWNQETFQQLGQKHSQPDHRGDDQFYL